MLRGLTRLVRWVWRHRARFAPYLFVAPFLLSFAAFGLYPLGNSVYQMFHQYESLSLARWVGLRNFGYVLTDPDFPLAVWNTLVFTFFSLCVQLPLALGLAMMLNHRRLRGRAVFRLVFFLPFLIGLVFTGIVFRVILNPDGPLNMALDATAGALLRQLGWDVSLASVGWLTSPALAMPAVIGVSLWLYVGFNMIYFLAALQAVDDQLYDAAKVDGAGPWRRFWHVTLPGIKPVAVLVVVLSTIGSFQLFELPWLMTGAGPDNAVLTVVMYLYSVGFGTDYQPGRASVVGWCLVAAVMAIALVQMWLARRMGGGDDT